MPTDEELWQICTQIATGETPTPLELYDVLVQNSEQTFRLLSQAIHGNTELDLGIGVTVLIDLEQSNILIYPESKAMVLDALRNARPDYYSDVLITVLDSLLHLRRDPQIEKALLPFLFSEEDSIRYTLLLIFGWIDDPESIPYLALLLDDENPQVAETSHYVLKNMSQPQAVFAIYEWERRKLKSYTFGR